MKANETQQLRADAPGPGMAPEVWSPRFLLQNELTRRCAKNPRYSLRAFAKALGMSHTVLSLVLSGKRPLSRKAALQVASALELAPAERQRLLEYREARTLRALASS